MTQALNHRAPRWTNPLRRIAIASCVIASAGASVVQAATFQPAAPPAQPQQAAETGYQRVREEADGVVTLELASREFKPAAGDGPRIHLVSAIHIADEQYYTAIQKQLNDYDIVLFEGVKPPGTGEVPPEATDQQRSDQTRLRLDSLKRVAEQEWIRTGQVPPDLNAFLDGPAKRWKTLRTLYVDGWGRPIHYAPAAENDAADKPRMRFWSDGADPANSADDIAVEITTLKGAKAKSVGMQAKLARALKLAFQLDAIDSSHDHWRPSDMSMDELKAAIASAGGDASMLLGMLDGSSFSAKLAGFLLGMIEKSGPMSTMVKVMLVELLGSPDVSELLQEGSRNVPGLDAMKIESVIIGGRNAVVVADIAAIVKNEPATKDIAVFYGAGHMPDLQRRLADLGYVPGDTTWTQAIRVDPRDSGLPVEQIASMRQMLKRMIETQLKAVKKP